MILLPRDWSHCTSRQRKLQCCMPPEEALVGQKRREKHGIGKSRLIAPCIELTEAQKNKRTLLLIIKATRQFSEFPCPSNKFASRRRVSSLSCPGWNASRSVESGTSQHGDEHGKTQRRSRSLLQGHGKEAEGTRAWEAGK
jgi:hypothetical protein